MTKAAFVYEAFYEGGSGHVCAFVTHAKKFTKEETVEICIDEFRDAFWDFSILEVELSDFIRKLRKPTVEDVKKSFVAFRFGLSPDDPKEGFYTFVQKGSPGSFPVWTIDFEWLEVE